jgi:hypothetical protein
MYKLSDKAYEYYKNSVNGRSGISKEDAELVLNRNIILGDFFPHKNFTHIYYGKLRMTINIPTQTILYVKNKTQHKGNPSQVKKKLLNEIMGIGG